MKIISLVYKEKPYYITNTAARNGYASGYTYRDFRFKFSDGSKTYPVVKVIQEDGICLAYLSNNQKIKVTKSEYEFMKENLI